MPTPKSLNDYFKESQELDPRYHEREIINEYERRVRVAESNLQRANTELKLKDRQLMSHTIDHWRTAIEELGKMEALLTEHIGHEKRLLGTEGMGWPGRLDQLVGELTRYRETLMRRIADKALERLAPALEAESGQREA